MTIAYTPLEKLNNTLISSNIIKYKTLASVSVAFYEYAAGTDTDKTNATTKFIANQVILSMSATAERSEVTLYVNNQSLGTFYILTNESKVISFNINEIEILPGTEIKAYLKVTTPGGEYLRGSFTILGYLPTS